MDAQTFRSAGQLLSFLKGMLVQDVGRSVTFQEIEEEKRLKLMKDFIVSCWITSNDVVEFDEAQYDNLCGSL